MTDNFFRPAFGAKIYALNIKKEIAYNNIIVKLIELDTLYKNNLPLEAILTKIFD